MINDVKALSEPHALEVVSASKVNVCLMHMLGNPMTMQTSPKYKSVNRDVKQFLLGRIEKCKQVGISRERLIVDPGFGFGKTVGAFATSPSNHWLRRCPCWNLDGRSWIDLSTP